MMKCPKCGYQRQPRDNQYVPATECPACGIVYAKTGPDSKNTKRHAVSLIRTPSPVDEESLRKARERVEMRLRKQLEARVRDKKYSQTLERARQITSLRLQQRMSARAEADKAANRPAAQPAEDREQKPAAAAEKPSAKPAETAVSEPRQTTARQETDGEPILDLVQIAVEGHQTDTSGNDNVSHRKANKDETPDQAAATSPSGPAPKPLAGDQSAQKESVHPAADEHAATQQEQEASQPDAQKKTDSERIRALPPARSQSKAQKKKAPTSEAAQLSYADDYYFQSRKTGGMARLLPVVAWLILLAGITGAVLSWTTLKDVHAGMFPLPVENFKSLPIGLLLGFAYLATGVLGFAFFWVSSLISRQLREIRHLLLAFPLPMPERDAAPEP